MTDTLVISDMESAKLCLSNCVPKHMSEIQLYSVHPGDHPSTLNAVFRSMEIFEPDFSRLPQVSVSALSEESRILSSVAQQAGESYVDLVNSWLRPGVSRLLFDCVFHDGPLQWSERLYRAAYQLVYFLDDKFQSEGEYMAGIEMLRDVIENDLNVSAFQPSETLARFATFATGHETPANILASILYNTRGEQVAKPSHLLLEGLRFDPPIQSLVRTIMSPIDIAGFSINPGQVVRIHLGMASRDQRFFRAPCLFDTSNSRENTGIFFGSPGGGCPGRHIAFDIAGLLLRVFHDEGCLLDIGNTSWRQNLDVRGTDRMDVKFRH